MQQFLLSLGQLSKPSSRDLCNAEDSDKTTMFVKTKITSNARKGKIQQNEYNEWGHWAAESSCFKTFWAVSPQRSSVNSTLPVSSRCTMGSGNVDILSSLSPWCSCDTLLLISSLDVPSTTNLKLFCQHLLFCWLVVKFLC